MIDWLIGFIKFNLIKSSVVRSASDSKMVSLMIMRNEFFWFLNDVEMRSHIYRHYLQPSKTMSIGIWHDKISSLLSLCYLSPLREFGWLIHWKTIKCLAKLLILTLTSKINQRLSSSTDFRETDQCPKGSKNCSITGIFSEKNNCVVLLMRIFDN